jgi:DNA-binding beta-propeller fold protein YncE
VPRARSSPLALAAIFAIVLAAGCSSSSKHTARHDTPKTPKTHRASAVVHKPVRLVERRLRTLAQPVQDAAAAPSGSGALLLGGLNSADSSIGDVRFVSQRADALRGSLPSIRHDAAAVELRGAAYVFGGGDATHQLDEIVRVGPGGRGSVVGRLPQPASDVAAAVIGGTAYVVGGYTGATWLNTILAWRPGLRPRVAGRLPQALRYAAVTAADGKLVIAGGSIPSGTASSSVLEFDPRTGRIRQIAQLPARTTHAAAAALGSIVYVIGGRGPTVDTPTRRILAVDLLTGTMRAAGALAAPLSDLAAVTVGHAILVAGGRGAGGTTASLGQLVPSTRASAKPKAVASVPKSLSRTNVYAADTPGDLMPAARRARPLIYVPNSQSDSVDEIDPRTFKVVRHFEVGALPQHVTPSYDLKTLYVLNDLGNSLTPINPRNGLPGRPIPVDDPYNMYFTPNGRYAIVVAERLGRLDFRFPHTFRLHRSLNVPCRGVDHMDFSADGHYLIASCEFSGQLIKVNLLNERLAGVISLPAGSSPQDVKLSPDGRTYYVADLRGGIWKVAGSPFRVAGFIRTGRGAHGLYVSRNDRFLYITNRAEGSISVLALASGKLVHKWWIPGGGSPDMGNVSVNGHVLWLSGRWNDVVYAIDTRNGRLLARIPVGAGPHGLCVWPQPGRYSLGHTGILR